jgi:transposase
MDAVTAARSTLAMLMSRFRDRRAAGSAAQDQVALHVLTTAREQITLPGIGAITAAVILCVWSHPGRVRTEAAMAMIAGTCPIPASSGNTEGHRLNRGGLRRLNREAS